MSADLSRRRFLTAVSFLTGFPVAKKEEDITGSVAYFPLVGLIIGGLLWACASAFGEAFPPGINALFVVAVVGIVTRAHSLHGLAITLDSLGGKGDVRDMGVLMRRGYHGTGGIIGLVLVVLAKYLLISHLIEVQSLVSLIFFPTVGRWAMVCGAWFFPVAEAELAGYVTSRDFWGATGITLLCAILTHGLIGVGIMVLVWISVYGLGHTWTKKRGKISIPVMGAGVELMEILALAILVGVLGTP
jgi:adenosylcobinamide-GDP ribazoletransferase